MSTEKGRNEEKEACYKSRVFELIPPDDSNELWKRPKVLMQLFLLKRNYRTVNNLNYVPLWDIDKIKS